MGINIHWTNHAREKMRFYHLSEQRVKRVLNSPKRIEEGIAPNTIAIMQVAGSKKHPYEIWAMVQGQKSTPTPKGRGSDPDVSVGKPTERRLRSVGEIKSQKLRVISAWKYPGRTKAGESLPEEILREIRLAMLTK